jgi:hypothetical protein
MANVVCASSEFDVFADRPLQTSTVNTVEIGHSRTTGVDQRDIEFTVAGDHDHYVDPDMYIYIYIRGDWLGQTAPF